MATSSLEEMANKSRRASVANFRMASMEHSQAYESHTFQRKIHFLSRSVCQICEERFSSVSFSVQECTQCKLYGHKACMAYTVIKCGPAYFICNPFDIPMFGTYLTELLEDLPVLVYKCVQELEKRGFAQIQFVYNANGDEEEVRKLKKAFDFAPKLVDLSEAAYYDIGTIVKRFFIELKIPLITSKPRRQMLDLIKLLPEDGLRHLDLCDRDEMKRIIKSKMANPHRVTLNYFMLHLKRLANERDLTNMGVSDFTEIFGPILCGRGDNPNALDAYVVEDKKLIYTLIWNANRIFDAKMAENPYG